MGLGAKLLDSIYSHYKGDATVVDITVEVFFTFGPFYNLTTSLLQDPSDNFVRLRDFVDAKNCLKLSAFSKEQVGLYQESHISRPFTFSVGGSGFHREDGRGSCKGVENLQKAGKLPCD